MKVLIVAGGEKPSLNLLMNLKSQCDLIIGADRGCDYLYESKIFPDYILGDFDSADINKIDKLERKGCKKIKFNEEKDFTDSDSAIDLAVREGATEIILTAVTGSRLDHTFSNLGLLLKALKLNIKASIVNDNNKIFLVNSSTELIKDTNFKYISFLAYGNNVRNVNITGAKYNLSNYNLELGDCRTVSNEFYEDIINLEFEKGNLLVIYTKD